MNLRLLLLGSPPHPTGAVLVAVDELAEARVGDVLGALGLPVDGADVDGRRVDPAEAALEVFVDGSTVALQGTTSARLFRRWRPPEEFACGSRLDFLLDPMNDSA